MEGTPLGLLVVVIFVALAAVAHYVTYRRAYDRRHRPIWIAFSLTGAAIVHIWAGFTGYNLSKHSRFVAGAAWSDTVIWWEVALGVVFAAVAAVCWRTGLSSIRRA